MWTPPTRNLDKVQFEELRKEIDPTFNALADELSDCYYNFWKQGLSKSFQGYDVQPTPEESKVLFDKLHGLIWHHYHIKFHQENLKRKPKDRYDEAKYNDITDSKGVKVDKRDSISAKEILKHKSEGIELTI